MNPDAESIPLYLVIIVLLLLLNTLVSLMNAAMETVSRSKIRQAAEAGGDRKAAVILKLVENPYKYRYANKLISYAAICVSLILVLALPYNRIASVIVYLAVVISITEIFPRKVAYQHAEGLARAFCSLQNAVCTILTPITAILLFVANILLAIFRQRTDIEQKEFSEEDVMSMLEEGQMSGDIKEEGKKMIGSIFRFDDELAYEIMTPRTDVFSIDVEDEPEEYLDKLMEMRYSRIPVYRHEPDEIIGILNIKDFLIKAREEGFDKVNIEAILRDPYFVPDSKNIDSLFFDLQNEKQHIAILIDEYGGFSGIVTMEDIIEEIVGEIDDEYDYEDKVVVKTDENTYLVNGNVDLDDLNEEIGTSFESDNSETIGGFIIDLLGEIPNDGYINQDIDYENCIFTLLSVKDRRVEKVRIKILEKDVNEDEQSQTERG